MQEFGEKSDDLTGVFNSCWVFERVGGLRVMGQVPNSLLSWNCRRSATSGYQCVPLGVLVKVMRNEEKNQ